MPRGAPTSRMSERRTSGRVSGPGSAIGSPARSSATWWWRSDRRAGDRKSTRLNSSHRCISYAVFCLKKKKEGKETQERGLIRNEQHQKEPACERNKERAAVAQRRQCGASIRRERLRAGLRGGRTRT